MAESRLQVPTAAWGDGLWPACSAPDITYNAWPGAGEIDYMEYVRPPNEIFGTIHRPGYAVISFGNIYDFGQRVDSAYHTFAVEWEPNEMQLVRRRHPLPPG